MGTSVGWGGLTKFLLDGGPPVPPGKKPSPQLSLCTKYALNNTTESLLESPTSWSKVRIYVMPSSKMRLKSVKFNFHFSDLLYTSFAKLLFYKRSHWNWLTTSKKWAVAWRVAKTIRNKEIIGFILLYLKNQYLQVPTHFLDHTHIYIQATFTFFILLEMIITNTSQP